MNNVHFKVLKLYSCKVIIFCTDSQLDFRPKTS